MKRSTIWEVNIGEALTVKRRTMVTTNQEVEDDVKDAPPIFEEGIQATVDELKEINTDTTKDVLRIGLINGKFLKHYYAWSLKYSLVRAKTAYLNTKRVHDVFPLLLKVFQKKKKKKPARLKTFV